MGCSQVSLHRERGDGHGENVQNKHRANGSFELRELLVVVAVIAILLGLTRRAFLTAEEAALKAMCKPSLRQGAVYDYDHERAAVFVKRRLLLECLVVSVVGGVGGGLCAAAAGWLIQKRKKRDGEHGPARSHPR